MPTHRERGWGPSPDNSGPQSHPRIPRRPGGRAQAVKEAGRRTGISKPAKGPSFAGHLLEPGYDARIIQGVPGYRDVNTTTGT
jgi:hypothetical protein